MLEDEGSALGVWDGGELAIQAITFNAFAVHDEAVQADANHGVWGLLQSLSREHSHLRVSLLDLDRAECGGDTAEATLAGCLPTLTGVSVAARRLVAWRQGRLYQRKLFTVQAAADTASRFRPGGAYLVVGGAGGVGMEFVRHLRQRLDGLQVVGGPPADRSRAFFGAWVTLADARGATRRHRIVGPDEFDREPGYISMDSPLGRALLGRRVDEEFELELPGGRQRYTVVAIEYQ